MIEPQPPAAPENSEIAPTIIQPKKRARVEDEPNDITLTDLTRMYIMMRATLDKQSITINRLEKEVSVLRSMRGATRRTSSVPPFAPPTVVTVDDDEVMASPSKTIPSIKPPSPIPSIKQPPSTPFRPILDRSTAANSDPTPPPENPHDLERSIVISRLPLDRSLSPEQQVRSDYDAVVRISAIIGYPVLPIAVYRMPVIDPDSRFPRLTKVLLPTRQHARLFLRHWKTLNGHPHFGEVHVRESIADPKDRKPTPPSKWNRKRDNLTQNRPALQRPPPITRPHNHNPSAFSRPYPNEPSNPNRIPISQPPQPRSRLNSLMSIRTNGSSRAPPRPDPTIRNKNMNHPNSTQIYRTPHPMIYPPQQLPLQYPFPPQYPNPFLSHISNYGVPPSFGLQGNWY